jgi:hypothetical protein
MNKTKIIAELENIVAARLSALSHGLRTEKQSPLV